MSCVTGSWMSSAAFLKKARHMLWTECDDDVVTFPEFQNVSISLTDSCSISASYDLTPTSPALWGGILPETHPEMGHGVLVRGEDCQWGLQCSQARRSAPTHHSELGLLLRELCCTLTSLCAVCTCDRLQMNVEPIYSCDFLRKV